MRKLSIRSRLDFIMIIEVDAIIYDELHMYKLQQKRYQRLLINSFFFN